MSAQSGKYQFFFGHLNTSRERNQILSTSDNKSLKNQFQNKESSQNNKTQIVETSSQGRSFLNKSLSSPHLEKYDYVPSKIIVPETQVINLPNQLKNSQSLQILAIRDSKKQINNNLLRLQNFFQYTTVCIDPMSSNQKKGYQYYFKKSDNTDGRQSWSKLPSEIKTQPYIRYEKYQKSKFTNNPDSVSASKDPHGEKVNATFGVEKRSSLYSSGYTPMKIQLHRQPSIEEKTQKSDFKSINHNVHSIGGRYPLRISLNTDRIIESRTQVREVTNQIQQNSTKSLNESKVDQSQKNHQLFEMSPKSKQFEQFFNQTLGNGSLPLNHQKSNSQKIQNYRNSLINNSHQIKYRDEIEQFKTHLKTSQIDETTIHVDSQIGMPIQKDETTQQTINGKIQRFCSDCQNYKKKLQKSVNENVELQKKRQANLDQILRQQKTIKEMQENQLKHKKELSIYQKQRSELSSKIESLQKQNNDAKTSYTTLQAQFHSILQSQLDKVNERNSQTMQSLQQKISAYVSTISRQNKKIDEIQENNHKTQKEMCEQKQKEIQKMKIMHGQQMSRVRETMKQQNSTIGKYYLQRQKKLVERQQGKIEEIKQIQTKNMLALKQQNETALQHLIQKHNEETLKLTTEITTLTQTLTQITTLTETIQKQDIELLQEKTAKYSVQKELNSYKLYVEQLKKDLSLEKECFLKVVKQLQESKEQINMLNEVKDKYQRDIVCSGEVVNGLSSQLEGERKKCNQIQKQFVLLKFMNQAFKVITDQQQYQSIQSKIKSIIQSGGSIQTITQELLNQIQQEPPSQQAEESSISPSTSGHSRPHKKSVNKKQRQTQTNHIKELNIKLTQLSIKYEQKLKELQKKDDLLLMNQKKIKVLEQNIKTQKILNEELQATSQKKIDDLQTQLVEKQNFITELNLKVISLVEQLGEKDDFVMENSSVIERLESSLKELMNERDDEKQTDDWQLKDLSPQKNKSVNSSRSIQSSDSKSQTQSSNDEIHLKSPEKFDQSSQQQQKENQSPKQQNQQSRSGQSLKNSPSSSNQAVFLQQIQSKDFQISELSQQLEESFQIIKVLKQQLQEREKHFALFQQESSKQLSSPKKINKHNKNLELSPQHLVTEHEQNQTEEIIKQYFMKIQEFYNEVLEIFGLEQVSSEIMNLQNNLSPIKSPRHQRDDVRQGQLQGEKKQHLVGLQLESINDNSLSQGKLSSLQNSPHKQSIHSRDSFQQAMSFLSSNQQQVLRIINQWIRKLQRQSMSIHQGKQKIHGLQRQLKQFQQYNSVISIQKLQIYEKYEAFIAKLDQENTHLEEKGVEMGQKITQLETYIKQLENLIQETNRQCLKNGLYSLQLVKEHSLGSFKPLYFNPYELSLKEKKAIQKQPELLMSKEKNAIHHNSLDYLNKLLISEYTEEKKDPQTRVTKSYWEQFYQTHKKIDDLSKEEIEVVDQSFEVDDVTQIKKRCKTLQMLSRTQQNSEQIDAENEQSTDRQLDLKLEIMNIEIQVSSIDQTSIQ